MGKKAKREGKSRIVIADEGLEFVNRSGKVLARLCETGGDTTMFSLIADDGTSAVALGTMDGAAFIRLGTQAAKVIVYTGQAKAKIQLYGPGEQPEVHLGTTEGGGLIEVDTLDGTTAASMCVVDDGGLVTVARAEGIVGGLGTSIHGGGLFINRISGESSAAIYTKDGEGIVEAYDAHGKKKSVGEQQQTD